MKSPTSTRTMPVTLMGLGVYGGGLGVARWLLDRGRAVLITDLRDAAALEGALTTLRPDIDAGRVRLRLGEHCLADFTGAAEVVVNPAVPRPWANRYVRAAEAGGASVVTEIQMLTRRLPSPDRVIAVTGAAGKSTTASLIAHLLQAALPAGMRAWLGGNIGGSLLSRLDEIDGADWVVLEVSSAMLHWLSRDEWRPAIAVLTNIAPNHLDWHGDIDHYVACKHHVTRFQRADDVLIRSPMDASTAPPTAAREAVVAGDSFEAPAGFALLGAHNRANASLAVRAASEAVMRSVGAAPARGLIDGALATFGGLPHRLERLPSLRRPDGAVVHAINDSKCTTPEALARAVEAVRAASPCASIQLICGGYDKGVDLSPIAEAGLSCAHVWTIGATGSAIASACRRRGVAAEVCEDLASAVSGATGASASGDVVLLSPGCASWDQFENFEARGRAFASLMRAADPNKIE